jgi:hypothetical protein
MFSLIVSGSDVSGKVEFPDDVAHRLKVVALVQADALGHCHGGHRTRSHDAVQRTSDQLHVMPVGTVNGQRNRDADHFGQQAALDALLAPVHRVRPSF